MTSFKHAVELLPVAALICLGSLSPAQPGKAPPAPSTFLGFDRNEYPGDDALPALRRTFAYTGFWLNPPPGEPVNSWTGKRAILRRHGFGFLVLFNGKTYSQIRSGDSGAAGEADGRSAAEAARKEGFPRETVIFLDQEEGGRLLPEQKAYLYAWGDAVVAAGFRTGVYCSGMAAREQGGAVVVTAQDIADHAEGRKISFWVTNDACAPSPGCVFASHPPAPAESGVSFADVWQFAQSPRRRRLTRACAGTYNRDGNCYPPGFDPQGRLHVDLNTALSADPSHGRGEP
jgi:hypothetical protein